MMYRHRADPDVQSLSGSDIEFDQDGNAELQVEKILDVRLGKNGEREYQIKFKALDYDETAWFERRDLEANPAIAPVLKLWEASVGRDAVIAVETQKANYSGLENRNRIQGSDHPRIADVRVSEEMARKKKELELEANRVPVGKSARRRWDGAPEYKIKRKEGASNFDTKSHTKPVPNQEELFGLSKVDPEQQSEIDWLSEQNWDEQPNKQVELELPVIKGIPVSNFMYEQDDTSDQVFSALPLHKRTAKDPKKLVNKPIPGPSQHSPNQAKPEPTNPIMKSMILQSTKCSVDHAQTVAGSSCEKVRKSFRLRVSPKKIPPVKDEVKTLTTVALSRDDYTIGDVPCSKKADPTKNQPSQLLEPSKPPEKQGMFGLVVPGYTNKIHDLKGANKPKDSSDPLVEVTTSPEPDDPDQVEEADPLYDRHTYYTAYKELIGKRAPHGDAGYHPSSTSSSSRSSLYQAPSNFNSATDPDQPEPLSRTSNRHTEGQTSSDAYRYSRPTHTDPTYQRGGAESLNLQGETNNRHNTDDVYRQNWQKASPPSHVPRQGRGPRHRQQELLAAVQRGIARSAQVGVGAAGGVSSAGVPRSANGSVHSGTRGFAGDRVSQGYLGGSHGVYGSQQPRQAPYPPQQQFPMARVSRYPPPESSTSYRSTSEFSQFY